MNQKDCEKKVDAIIEGIKYWAVDNDWGDCDECKFYSCHEEHHPYGSTTASERLCECTVPDDKDCPVVEQVTAALYNRVMLVKKEESGT
jgi:hypothetical protein